MSLRQTASDPVNKGWISTDAPPQEPPDKRYIKTKDWGWIDTAHFGGGAQHAKELLDALNDPTKSSVTLEKYVPKSGQAVNFEVSYRIANPVSEQFRVGVALGMFMDLETRWEEFEYKWFSIDGTGFAIEDFPSDYLGFYSYATGYSRTYILEEILKEKNYTLTSESPPRCQYLSPCLNRLNFEFRPKVWDWASMSYLNKDWPPELRLFPINWLPTYGNFWSFAGCNAWFILNLPMIGTRAIDASSSCN